MDSNIGIRLNRYGRQVRTLLVLPDADVSEPELDDDSDIENDNTGEQSETEASSSHDNEEEVDVTQRKSPKNSLEWSHVKCAALTLNFEDETPVVDAVREPIQYFREYWRRGLSQYVVDQSNMYALQCNGTFRITIAELDAYIGVLIRMGISSLPRYRMYWSNEFRLAAVADVMTRDRFFQINKYIHFANNNEIITRRADPNYDRLFKIRPLLHFIRGACLKMWNGQHHSVDEQMIPYKGKTGNIYQKSQRSGDLRSSHEIAQMDSHMISSCMKERLQ